MQLFGYTRLSLSELPDAFFLHHAIKGFESLIDFVPSIRGFRQDSKMQNKLSEYVKIAEAATILGVSQVTLRTWAESGKIPMHKNPANGYRLFRRDDLEKFLAMVAIPLRSKQS